MPCRSLCFSLLLSALVLGGCSAIVSPDESRLGGDGGTTTDTGTGSDTGPPIVLMDSGGPGDGGVSDATTPPDATVVDATMACMGDPYCEGDVLVSCPDGVPTTTDCQSMGSYCMDSECVDWSCTPGSSRCDGSGRVATCDARGMHEMRMDCMYGCDPDTNACRPPPTTSCPGVPPLALGASVMVNTCGQGDDTDHLPTGDGGGCPAMQRSNGGDLMYAITLTSRQTVTLDLRDDDGRAAIDTILYIRTDCESRTSQIACSDDLPCGETAFGCSSGTMYEVRESRITMTLEPGTYYVIVDTFNYTLRSGQMYTCGDVLLSYRAAAVTPTP